MGAYIARRLWQTIPTLAGVILLVFILFNWVGGDPALVLAGKVPDPAQIANIRRQLGLDEPWWVQLWIFVQQVFTFDFGRSWSTNQLVSDVLLTRIGPTLTVMVPMLLIETFLAVTLALLVAWVRGSLTDRAIMVITTVAMSISFLVYIIVLQWLLAFELAWFPVQGWSDDLWTNLTVYAPLPVLLGVLVSLAPSLRLYRSFVLDEVGQDYVRTARGQGPHREPGDAGARAAQRTHPDPDLRRHRPARAVRRLVPAGDLLLHSRPRTRGDRVGQSQRLPGDQGHHGVSGHAHHAGQPAGRRAVPGGRSAGDLQVSEGLPREASPGLWALAWRRLRRDYVAVTCMVVVAGFLLLMLASMAGLVAAGWEEEVGVSYARPAFAPGTDEAATDAGGAAAGRSRVPVDLSDLDPLAPRYAEWQERAAQVTQSVPARSRTLPLGGDQWGRDVLAKTIKGSEVSILVGLAAALIATTIGTLLGALAGYWGGRVNDLLEWLYNVFTSIPYILLILAFAAVLGRGVTTIIMILGLTGWTGIYRLMRAEYMKHREREYVLAARAIGVSDAQRMFAHILPNTSHVVLVQFSLLVVAFIKTEVILSFLGLGVPVDVVSWGTILAEAQNELVMGKWWQLTVAGAAMALLVTAVSLLTDSMRDALDPKLR